MFRRARETRWRKRPGRLEGDRQLGLMKHVVDAELRSAPVHQHDVRVEAPCLGVKHLEPGSLQEQRQRAGGEIVEMCQPDVPIASAEDPD